MKDDGEEERERGGEVEKGDGKRERMEQGYGGGKFRLHSHNTPQTTNKSPAEFPRP